MCARSSRALAMTSSTSTVVTFWRQNSRVIERGDRFLAQLLLDRLIFRWRFYRVDLKRNFVTLGEPVDTLDDFQRRRIEGVWRNRRSHARVDFILLNEFLGAHQSLFGRRVIRHRKADDGLTEHASQPCLVGGPGYLLFEVVL